MTERLGAADRPLRIAIIGAGPAGLYAADSLLRKRDISLTIDVFNRFPTPFGLVRDGVAPDHQSIKAVAESSTRSWPIHGCGISEMSPTVLTSTIGS